jgi:hypothetical protein
MTSSHASSKRAKERTEVHETPDMRHPCLVAAGCHGRRCPALPSRWRPSPRAGGNGAAIFGLSLGLLALGAIAASSQRDRYSDRYYDSYGYGPPPPPPLRYRQRYGYDGYGYRY